ncbi:hypothetical protein EG349_14645 [Chryseobacterium shandongense]|jgi:hypothetical protein|uniref:Uncharacterized protein n=1 Tax=Chryseobacterium shandongense TaxID=1493872 RepID=A0AAD0YJH4_9FLAO|nr:MULTISPECIES: hypothetical protein [Chryseobacterium]AZA87946.1 hypothetical protein EG349_14645 [Chryseobacterium shandongense]AZA96506.1 hypothetical protein EG353_13425 [Chryseobacterium shandongense]
MILTEEEKQVTDYLILHRLPLDVLLEVKDHMISQISDIQANEKLSFNEAFHKTQKLWADEFKMTTYSAFYNGGIPLILKKIVKEKYNNIIRKSLLLGIVASLLSLSLVFISKNQPTYNNLFRIYNSLFLITPFLLWVFNKEIRKHVRRDFKYDGKLLFTIYQQNLALFISCIGLMFQFVTREDKYLFRFFRTDDTVSIFPLMLTFILPYFMYSMMIFVMINFLEHKKTLKSLKSFLDISQ